MAEVMAPPVRFPFIQQTLGCLTSPSLMRLGPSPPVQGERAIRDAAEALGSCKSVGAYTSRQGDPYFREKVAQYFWRRDGVKADIQSLFMNGGYRDAAALICHVMLSSKTDGVLILNPAATSFIDTVKRRSAHCIYAPSEMIDDLDYLPFRFTETEEALRVFLSANPNNKCKALYVTDVYPATPQGSKMRRDIINFCARNGCVLIVDDSFHQRESIRSGFHSFRSINESRSGGPVEIFTILSLSHLIRGGIVDASAMLIEHVSKEIFALIVKVASISLCSSVVGQGVLAYYLSQLLVDKDFVNEVAPDYAYIGEAQAADLEERHLIESFWKDGSSRVRCAPVSLDKVARLSVKLPKSFVEKARKCRENCDTLFAMRTELLLPDAPPLIPGSLVGLGGSRDPNVIILIPFNGINGASTLLEVLTRLNHAFKIILKD